MLVKVEKLSGFLIIKIEYKLSNRVKFTFLSIIVVILRKFEIKIKESKFSSPINLIFFGFVVLSFIIRLVLLLFSSNLSLSNSILTFLLFSFIIKSISNLILFSILYVILNERELFLYI